MKDDVTLIVNVEEDYFNGYIKGRVEVETVGFVSYLAFHDDKTRHPPKRDIKYLAFVITKRGEKRSVSHYAKIIKRIQLKRKHLGEYNKKRGEKEGDPNLIDTFEVLIVDELKEFNTPINESLKFSGTKKTTLTRLWKFNDTKWL